MNFLLPHRFKKVGAIIAPLGLFTWVCMQRGLVTRVMSFFFGENPGTLNSSPYHLANVTIAIISFFSFLGGIYFVTFSKERVEDEMVQRTRLDSFQFAALVQIIFLIIGFLSMFLFREPGKEGLMLFFISVIFLFWLCFIGRFNYILHIMIK
jgi:uncharacterized membrane protein